jgi:chromosomal replication initiator protein
MPVRVSSGNTRGPAFLNPRYTFENFVVGAGNRLCHAAALAVAEAPGRAYNPLFIYGGVGLGKTHLMQAVGHYIHATRPNLRIQNITTEAFVSDVVTSTKENRLFDFSNQFRNTDLLMVDDIQYLENKERTQDIFFQAFNHLHEAQKQIIVTCDRLPKDIPTLTERLKSRLGNGLITDINPPDFETRLAILQKKLEDDKFHLSESVLDYIASTIKTNIRDLEGALNRIEFQASYNGEEINIEFVQKIIHDIAPAQSPGPASPDAIISAVSRHYNIPVEDIKGRCRKKEMVRARHVSMSLIREMTGMQYERIGGLFGKDHSSVITSCEKIKMELERDASLRRDLDSIRARVLQS